MNTLYIWQLLIYSTSGLRDGECGPDRRGGLRTPKHPPGRGCATHTDPRQYSSYMVASYNRESVFEAFQGCGEFFLIGYVVDFLLLLQDDKLATIGIAAERSALKTAQDGDPFVPVGLVFANAAKLTRTRARRQTKHVHLAWE